MSDVTDTDTDAASDSDTDEEAAPDAAEPSAAEALPTGPVDPTEVDPHPVDAAEAVQARQSREEAIAQQAASRTGADVDAEEEEDVDGLVYEHDVETDGDAEAPAPVESPYDRPGRWYVVHTQSGYEKRVKQNLEARTQSMNMEGRIHEIVIPMEDVVEFKNGKKVVVQKKVFPGYLLVRCYLDDDSWYVIRNTPGVTGFVGAGSKPTPLPRRDVEAFLQVKPEGDEVQKRSRPRLQYEMGETVRVKEGPFADFSGEVIEINPDQLKVKVLVNIFGRETPVELEFAQVAKL